MSHPLPPRLPFAIKPHDVALPLLPARPARQIWITPPPAAGATPADGAPRAPHRGKLWELADTLHCSIIGTCLSTAELRHTLGKLDVPGIDRASEHELHTIGVTLAGRPDSGAKLLHKALDRRHAVTLKHYAKAGTEAGVLDLWKASVRDGDIPGAYWAVLTHPAATHALVRVAFGDVHMLSHLVGAANRADIRKLRQLEEENARLLVQVEKQQQQLHQGFTARDETIRRLNATLARQVTQSDATRSPAPDDDALRLLVRDMESRLSAERARRARLEQRCDALATTVNARDEAIRELRRDCDLRQHELELIEARLDASRPSGPALDLGGRIILYVGGRANQIPQMRAMAEQCGAQLLDHDGGIDQSAALLPGLVSRADIVLFPVDCVSHDSAIRLKRLCRQAAKPFHPLRTASLSTLMAALAALAPLRAIAAE